MGRLRNLKPALKTVPTRLGYGDERSYDRQRGPSSRRGYGARWRKASALYRQQHPLCLGCQAVGRVTATELVDHVEPHKGDERLFWDQDNWQPCCRWHHDKVKQRLEQMYERGEIDTEELRLDSATATRLTQQLMDAQPAG